MKVHTALTLSAVVPESGLHWVFRDVEGAWSVKDPPADWPEEDYAAAVPEDLEAPLTSKQYVLADKFYLAAPIEESFPDEQLKRKRLREPGLYQRFASERATPSTMLGLANRFGFLGLHGDPQHAEYAPSDLRLRVESAARWLGEFARTRCILKEWSELQERGDRRAMAAYLGDLYTYPMGGELGLHIRLDVETGEVQSELVVPTLSSFIEIQLGLAIADVPAHRKCGSCSNWFPIFPAPGRPEKLYCSDACRMRAYRKRKAVT
jgi:hypothetical protein